jgi:hypothetical protein
VNSLCLVPPGFLGEPGQVGGIASEQNDRPRLSQRDDGHQRVEGAPMPGKPGAAEQFACRATLLLADRDHRELTENAVHRCVAWAAAQYLGQRRCGRDNVAAPPASSLETIPGTRIAAGELDETLGIQDQSAA